MSDAERRSYRICPLKQPSLLQILKQRACYNVVLENIMNQISCFKKRMGEEGKLQREGDRSTWFKSSAGPQIAFYESTSCIQWNI